MSVGTGSYMNPRDGDVVEIAVDTSDGFVHVTRVSVRGCAAAKRVAAEVSLRSRLRTPEDAARIEPTELIHRLELLPDEERCALTVVAAFRAALVDAHVKTLA